MPPRTIGPYEVVREIGRGGMGVVLLARQPALARNVALKVLRPDAMDETTVARFRREAEAMARLNHEGVVRVLDLGVEAGHLFLVMDFIEGEALSDTIKRRGRLSDREALEMVRHIGRALAHIHAHGIIHRDLKPMNVLVAENGRPIITDFGLSADEQRPLHLTMDGTVVGTPHYMAPEQASGRGPVDARSDVYALGVILFELLTGRNPHASGSARTAIQRAAIGILPAPSLLDPGIDPGADAICRRATASDPARRYQSADGMVADIEKWLDAAARAHTNLQARARRRTTGRRFAEQGLSPPVRLPRVRVAALAGGVVALAVGSATTVLLLAGRGASAPPKTVAASAEPGVGAPRPSDAPTGAGRDPAPPVEAGPTEADRRRAADHVAQARRLLRSGETEAACTCWQRAFDIDPALVLDHLHGELDRSEPSMTGAVTAWLERAAASRDASVAATARGELLARSNALAAAVASFDRALGDSPDEPRARLGRALARWQRGEWEAAIEDAAVAARGSADGIAPLVHGRLLRQRRRHAESRAVLARVRDAHPDLAAALVELGWIAVERFESEEAARLFEAARELEPGGATATAALGWLRLRESDTRERGLPPPRRVRLVEQARDHGERALAIEPDRAAHAALLALSKARLGQPGEARELAERAFALDPRDSRAVEARHFTLVITDRAREADEALDRWLAVAPDPASVHLARAWWRLLADRPRDARAEVDAALSAAPDDPTIALGAIRVLTGLLGSGDGPDGAGLFDRIVERARARSPEVLAAYCRDVGLDEAMVTRVPSLIPARRQVVINNGDYFGRARALIESGDLAGAEALYLERNRLEPRTPWACIELVQLYLRSDAPERLGRDRATLQGAALEQGRLAVEVTGPSGWVEWTALPSRSGRSPKPPPDTPTRPARGARRAREEMGGQLFGAGMDREAMEVLGQVDRILGGAPSFGR